MDMTKATITTTDEAELTQVTVPALGTGANGASIEGNIKDDHERSSPAHAIFMCFAFLVAFPLGVFAARILGKVTIHAGLQGIGMLFVIIGLGVGIYISKYYNRVSFLSQGSQQCTPN